MFLFVSIWFVLVSNWFKRMQGVIDETRFTTNPNNNDVWSSMAAATHSLHGNDYMKMNVYFTPDEFRAKRHDKYVNLPVLPPNVTRATMQASIQKALSRKVHKPYGLLHEGCPPGRNAVMGLAAYPSAMDTFVNMVGSLRNTGYDGHIILGVHSKIPADEQEYLKKMDVTFYAVEFVACHDSILTNGNDENNVVRGLCSKGLEKLKLEWGRFEMARQWLYACEKCTGWSLVMDTRDVFFQVNPFDSLPQPPEASPYDLMFVEEISRHSCPQDKSHDPRRYYTLSNSFYQGDLNGCYGEYHKQFPDRPVLCSGTILGTRKGIDRFLSVFVNEFYANNQKENLLCRSPHTTDQLMLQYMYYTGMFGDPETTRTSPWGTGPVMTIGHACVDNSKTPSHSQMDIVQFDNTTGLILNNNEIGDAFRIAPLVHQYDRCWDWALEFMKKHEELFTPAEKSKQVPWLIKSNNRTQ